MKDAHLTRRSFNLGAAGTLGAIGVSGLLAGCGNLSTTGASSGSDASADDGSMLVAMDNGSPTFDKNFNPYSSSRRTAANLIFEPLFVLNTINGELSPFLAEKYEQPDASTIQVTLRSGVTWTDGQDFTVDDVLYSYNLVKEQSALDLNGVWGELKSIEGSGNTVTMTLNEDNVWATTIVLTTAIVPKHLWEKIDDPTTDTVESPVGTGPYTLGDFTPNQYTLEKNDDYYNADAVVVQKLILPASNEELDLVNKGYDWAYAFISDVENTWVKANEGNTYWFPPGGTVSLIPLLSQGPWTDVNFRQGIFYALDRDKIADTAEEGYVDAAGSTGLLLPNQDDWLDPSIADKGLVAQDTDKALEYFQKAGYTKNGDQLVGEDGKQVSLTIMTPNSYSDWLRGAQEVQRELQAIGIAVKLNQPQAAGYQQSLQAGDFDVAMASFGGNGDVFSSFHNTLGSDFAKPVGEATTSNYGRYASDDADDLIGTLRAAQDEDTQKQATYGLEKIFATDMPVIPLFYGGLWGLFSSKKYTGWPSEKDDYASPATWGNNPLLIVTRITKA